VAFRGKALVAIWNDIVESGRADFIEWHNREHVFERLSVAGFLAGYRYRAVSGTPEYFTLYEVESMSTTTGSEYLSRLNNPTAWTKRALQLYRNLSRSLCEVVYSQGRGRGGFLHTISFDARVGMADSLRTNLCDIVLPPIHAMAEITGVHLGIADNEASNVRSEEKKDHSVTVPGWVVLIEASSAAAALQGGTRCREIGLAHAGVATEIKSNLYSMEFSCRREELTGAGAP
jgi:hypothetical protein